MTGLFKLGLLFTAVNHTDGVFAKIRNNTERIKGGFNKLNASIMALATPVNFLASGAIKKLFEAGAQLESTKISMGVLLKGDKNAVSTLMQEWKTLGAKTNLDDNDIFGVGKMMLSFRAVNKATATDTLRMLADLSGAADNPKEAFKGLGIVFSQVMSMGKLQGQDLLQFINQGFNPVAEMVTMIKEGVGAAAFKGWDLKMLRGQSDIAITAYIKEKMQKGLVSAQSVLAAIKRATGKGGLYEGMQEKLSATASGQWSTLVSNFKATLAEVGTSLMPMFKEVISGLSILLKKAAALVTRFPGVIKAIGYGALAAGGLWTAFKAYGVITHAVKALQMLRIALMASGIAMRSATLLTRIWNGALMANPVIAIASGVLLLGAGLYALSQHFSRATTQYELMGVVRKEAQARMADERAGLELLFRQLKQTNPQSQERKEILDRLKAQYPQYLQDLRLEKAANEDIAASYDKITEAMEKKLYKEIVEEKMKEALKKKFELQQEFQEQSEDLSGKNGFWAQLKADAQYFFTDFANYIDGATLDKGYNKDIAEQETIITNLPKSLETLTATKKLPPNNVQNTMQYAPVIHISGEMTEKSKTVLQETLQSNGTEFFNNYQEIERLNLRAYYINPKDL